VTTTHKRRCGRRDQPVGSACEASWAISKAAGKTRFPSEIDQSGWEYDNLAYLQELVTYWRTTTTGAGTQAESAAQYTTTSTAFRFTSFISDPVNRTRPRWS
jgi:hypothetical protein